MGNLNQQCLNWKNIFLMKFILDKLVVDYQISMDPAGKSTCSISAENRIFMFFGFFNPFSRKYECSKNLQTTGDRHLGQAG